MKVKFEFLLKAAILFVSGMIVLLLCSSCNKYALYQQDAKSGATAPEAKMSEKELAQGDKISLSIWGHDELSIGSIHSVYNSPDETASGKWLMIDQNGEVNLPQIGKVKLVGMTLRKAEEHLKKIYSSQLQNPILNLRLLNNQVTVLGEVQRPGTYVFHTDFARMVDMIGKASGFTDYAKTTEIKIIRGTETIKVDLTNASFNQMTVLPRDVIYVPPGRNKAFDRFASKMIPLASLLTALALVYNVSKD
jgi:polysaccharide export outer membrane protein